MTIIIIVGLVLLALIAVLLAFIAGIAVGANFERMHAYVTEVDDDLPEQVPMSIRELTDRVRADDYGVRHDA